MRTLDERRLETLLDGEKYDEARSLIEAALREPLDEASTGEAYVSIAAIYLDVMNTQMRRYETALDDAIAVTNELNARERKSLDDLKLVETQLGIQKHGDG